MSRAPRRPALRAVGVMSVLGLFLAGCAGEDPPDRRTIGELVALHMYPELEPATTTRIVDRDGDQSSAARGRPKGYRRAVVLEDPGVTCGPGATVGCGAKIEVFADAEQARQRMTLLSRRGATGPGREIRYQGGALVLRVSGELGEDGVDRYRRAFRAGLAELPSHLARTAEVDDPVRLRRG